MSDFVIFVGIVGTSLGALAFLMRRATLQEATERETEIRRWRSEADRKIRELELSIGGPLSSHIPPVSEDGVGPPQVTDGRPSTAAAVPSASVDGGGAAPAALPR